MCTQILADRPPDGFRQRALEQVRRMKYALLVDCHQQSDSFCVLCGPADLQFLYMEAAFTQI